MLFDKSKLPCDLIFPLESIIVLLLLIFIFFDTSKVPPINKLPFEELITNLSLFRVKFPEISTLPDT